MFRKRVIGEALSARFCHAFMQNKAMHNLPSAVRHVRFQGFLPLCFGGVEKEEGCVLVRDCKNKAPQNVSLHFNTNQLGFTDVNGNEVYLSQVTKRQIDAAQISALEIATAKLSEGQIGINKLGISQIRFSQINWHG
nr:hypothetical protein [Candidatus Sodalis endolongispinus]